jgi:hypothetical protein
MGCGHKTQNDHSYMTPNGRIWVCSNCDQHQKWGPSWGYYGNMECKKCGWAQIDWVACCDECAEALKAKTKT